MLSQDLRQANIDDDLDRLVGIEDAMPRHVVVATVLYMVINVMAVIEMVIEAMRTVAAAHLVAAKVPLRPRINHYHRQGQRILNGIEQCHQDV